MTQQKSAQPRKNAELGAPVTTRSLHATKAQAIERSRTRVNDAPSSTTGAALALTQVGNITMSSREIAELTGKQIGHVHRDIRAMLGAIVGIADGDTLGSSMDWELRSGEMNKVLDHPDVAGVTVDWDARGYAKQVNLTKDLTMTLVAGYNIRIRHAIVKRWQELEAQQAPAPAIPQTWAQALRLAAEQAEQLEHQQAALSLAAPKVEFVDRFVSADGLKGFREVCKLLKANEAHFREFVFAQRIMYRLGGTLTAYQPHIDAGRFDVKAGVADNEHAYTVTKFTPKGVAWIAELWAQGRQCLEKMGVK